MEKTSSYLGKDTVLEGNLIFKGTLTWIVSLRGTFLLREPLLLVKMER